MAKQTTETEPTAPAMTSEQFSQVLATTTYTVGYGSPGAPIGSDNWSVRWVGLLEAVATGWHTLRIAPHGR